MPTLTCSPTPAPPSSVVSVAGAGFANAKTRLLLDGAGASTNVFRPRKDGTFNVGITVASSAKTQTLVAQQASGSTWKEVAKTTVEVKAVVTPPPVEPPPVEPPPVTPPPVTTGPLNDPQPDVSGVPVPAGFASGAMTLQQAIDQAAAGSVLNLAVNRTVNEGAQITKALTIVFGVAGGPQLTITRPDPSTAVALHSLADDVKLYRPKLRGIGTSVGVTPPQVSGIDAGALQLGGAWKGGVKRNLVVNADISDVRIDGISMQSSSGSPATDNQILASLIARAGRCGINGGGVEDWSGTLASGNWTIARSRVTACNTATYDGGVTAAAVKWLWLSSALVEDSEFDHTNGARGFWTDTGVAHLVFRRNRMHHNWNNGAFFESSHYVEAYENVAWANARNQGWGWGGGITLATSDHCDIHHNTIYQCGSGITVVSQQRQDTLIPKYGGTIDINVHDNTIIEPDIYGTAWVQDWGGVLFAPASNNRGSNNRYSVTTPEGKFAWNGDINTLSAYNATPAEENGRYLTATEKSAALAAAGLP